MFTKKDKQPDHTFLTRVTAMDQALQLVGTSGASADKLVEVANKIVDYYNQPVDTVVVTR